MQLYHVVCYRYWTIVHINICAKGAAACELICNCKGFHFIVIEINEPYFKRHKFFKSIPKYFVFNYPFVVRIYFVKCVQFLQIAVETFKLSGNLEVRLHLLKVKWIKQFICIYGARPFLQEQANILICKNGNP